MDPISTITSCLTIIQTMCEIRDQVASNAEEMRTLCLRTRALEPTLRVITSKLADSKADTTQEQRNNEVISNLETYLNELKAFIATNNNPYFYRTLTQIAYRNKYRDDIISFNVTLDRHRSDLHIIAQTHFEITVSEREERRLQDLMDMQKSHAFNMQMFSDQFSTISSHQDHEREILDMIFNEVQGVQRAMEKLGHRSLTDEESEQLSISRHETMKSVLHIELSVDKVLNNQIEQTNKLNQLLKQSQDMMESVTRSSAKEKKSFAMANSIDPNSLALGSLIDKGGYGYVYYGSLNQGPWDLAVKKLSHAGVLAEDLETRLEKIENEAFLLSTLSCPNIVSGYGYIHDKFKQESFILMELSPYGSLWKVVTDFELFPFKYFPFSVLIHCGVGVANAMRYMHSKGVVHKDIKAENVLLFHNLVVKICDFGTAKNLENQSSTVSGHFEGTRLFMSPEVVEKRSGSSPKSDVYGFSMFLIQIIVRNLLKMNEKPASGLIDEISEVRIASETEDLKVGLLEVIGSGTNPSKFVRPSSEEVYQRLLALLKKIPRETLFKDLQDTESNIKRKSKAMNTLSRDTTSTDKNRATMTTQLDENALFEQQQIMQLKEWFREKFPHMKPNNRESYAKELVKHDISTAEMFIELVIENDEEFSALQKSIFSTFDYKAIKKYCTSMSEVQTLRESQIIMSDVSEESETGKSTPIPEAVSTTSRYQDNNEMSFENLSLLMTKEEWLKSTKESSKMASSETDASSPSSVATNKIAATGDDKKRLHDAAMNNDLKTMKSILNTIDIDVVNYGNDKSGATALHWASRNGNVPAITQLLDHQADINAKTNFGYTPLMDTCLKGHLEVAKYLVSRGCDVHKKEYKGKTALAMAREKERYDIVEYLSSIGAGE